MEIPKEIKERFKKVEKRVWENHIKRPACWKQLGELSKMHGHDKDGNCITRNWSNSDPKRR